MFLEKRAAKVSEENTEVIAYVRGGEDEYHTPVDIICAARRVFGGRRFELDPASCEKANKIVQAEVFYTQQDNGLSPKYDWDAELLWLYPPVIDFEKWVRKWAKLGRNRVGRRHWFLLTSNDTSAPWAQSLLDDNRHLSQCFVSGESDTMSPIIWYRGINHDEFRRVFSELGAVL